MLDDDRRDQPAHEPHPPRPDGRLQLVPPAELLAKITSTIDVISGGRLDWGIGAGWYENEYKGYGYEFPAPKERIGMLRETVEIVKSMWTEPETTLRGPPLHDVAAPSATRSRCSSRTRRSGSAAAASSSRCGSSPATPTARTSAASPTSSPHKREVLKGHCTDVGRDYDEIRKTWSPEVFIRETEAEVGRRRSQLVLGRAGRVVAAGNLVGTPEQVAEKIQTYATSAAAASCRGAPTTPTPRR